MKKNDGLKTFDDIFSPSLFRNSYHPLAGIFISSDTPKESDPMKSFLVVRSQSQTSTDNRRSLSVGFNLLKKERNGGVVNTKINWMHAKTPQEIRVLNSQREWLIPVRIQGRTDGFCFLFTFILRIWDELQFDIRIWKSIWIHGNEVFCFSHCQYKTQDYTSLLRKKLHVRPELLKHADK